MCQSAGTLLAFPLVRFYGARTVWSVLQLLSHIYSMQSTCCQNNPAKSLLWMRLRHFQYLCTYVMHIALCAYCHIYASVNWVIIGSGNGLSSVWHQAITWTIASLLSIALLGTSFSEIGIGILSFSFKQMRLKTSSAKMVVILSRVEGVNAL